MFISILLLGDFSIVLLSLLQLYSISLLNFFLVLFILPLGLLFPFPAGISALFSHGPRRAAGLARIYALWNITSLINVVSCSGPNGFRIQKNSIGYKQAMPFFNSMIPDIFRLLTGCCIYLWIDSLYDPHEEEAFELSILEF